MEIEEGLLGAPGEGLEVSKTGDIRFTFGGVKGRCKS
jgi:hypothetical protein